MLEYYLMAMEKGNNDTMFNLGYYYEKQNDICNMLKCHMIAI
jgi:TPR repeat protein